MNNGMIVFAGAPEKGAGGERLELLLSRHSKLRFNSRSLRWSNLSGVVYRRLAKGAAMSATTSERYIFTGENSARSYRLNKMAVTLTSPANRAEFQADEDGYMRRLGLTDQEIDLVRRRDWKGMMDYGASIYLVIKIGGSVGATLPEIGAHTAGITVAEFHARQGR